MPAAARQALNGIHAILYSFFDTDELLDRAAMRRQVEICVGQGVAGIAALGLATEVAKLTLLERLAVMDWVAEDVAGRMPIGFTIVGASVAEQTAQIRHAETLGANWVILQPPMAGAYAAAEYIAFFTRVAQQTSLPVAIQNAPAYLGRGLGAADLVELMAASPNISLLKGEAPATEIAALIATTAGRLPVFNGRGGLELLDNLRAGCAGFILAPEVIDYAVCAYEAFRDGDNAAAELAYRDMLPTVVFIMQSIESLVSHGKRIFALRAGLEVHDRAPALRTSAFALETIALHAARLGPLRG